MNNRLSKKYFVICSVIFITSIILIIYFNCPGIVDKITDSNSIQVITNIVSILSGTAAILIGIATIKTSRLNAVKEYFQQGDKKEFVQARGKIYRIAEENEEADKETIIAKFKIIDNDIAIVISFFHFWGLMVKKGYLPMWVFEGSSGIKAVKLYRILKVYIDNKRKSTKNEKYAEEFEWLVKEIGRRYKLK